MQAVHRYFAVLVVAGAGCFSALSLATPENCGTIQADLARLACYDSFYAPVTADAASVDESGEMPDAPLDNQAAEVPTVAKELVDATREPSPVLSRRQQELALSDLWFSIAPHRTNYILPATINTSADFSAYGPFEESFNDVEVKFQFSLKTLLAEDLWRDSSIWVGYTQQSYWQLYAEEEASAPFRETNHQPEIFWDVPVDFNLLGWNARVATLALNHQSNGRSEPLSRSWNRVTGELVFDRGAFAASVKSWIRIQEDPETDNNPDLEDYMGRIQLGLAYKRGEQLFALGLKNNLSSDNRSGVELSWTFPLLHQLKGFVQIYSGYGENLIDAENYNNRIGVGVLLSDWY